jgi:hypothetical protein
METGVALASLTLASSMACFLAFVQSIHLRVTPRMRGRAAVDLRGCIHATFRRREGKSEGVSGCEQNHS